MTLMKTVRITRNSQLHRNKKLKIISSGKNLCFSIKLILMNLNRNQVAVNIKSKGRKEIRNLDTIIEENLSRKRKQIKNQKLLNL